MRPDEDSTTPEDKALASSEPTQSTQTTPTQQQATVELVRSQINSIYNGTPRAITGHSMHRTVAQPERSEASVYERTHSNTPEQPLPDEWKQYHTAWQTYYQKYYEGYYTHHLHQAKKELDLQQATTPISTEHNYFSHSTDAVETEETLSKDEALFDLRQKLLTRVTDSAKKVRKSRHFVPVTAAVLVVLAFLFLQYNRLLISNVVAYVSPGSIDPQNIVVDPTTDLSVSPEPRLIIPKINVDVPVIYDVGNDYNSQMAAMEKGVAHFAIPGASSHPGQIGNTVISGHSSNDLLDGGDYKFIFAQLEKLQVGDSIYANYQGKRYTYTITKKEVVLPNEVNKLTYTTNEPVLTLITCTPLGTALKRLLVTAKQVSPDPSSSAAAPVVTETGAEQDIPGNSPTLFERLFGAS